MLVANRKYIYDSCRKATGESGLEGGGLAGEKLRPPGLKAPFSGVINAALKGRLFLGAARGRDRSKSQRSAAQSSKT